ncbi:MAG TPA: PilZ domain-containing protein [Thermoanaerobaculia bacterium]|nr:PilZ domain-containing protein [Thermoanaerobaculia bacterium]
MEGRQEEMGDHPAFRYLLAPRLPVEVESLGETRLTNLSIGGARLEHSLPVDPGSIIRLKARLPETSSDFSLRARVVWTSLACRRPDGSRSFVSGLHFTDPAPELLVAVQYLRAVGRATPLDPLRRSVRYLFTPPLVASRQGNGEAMLLDASASGLRAEGDKLFRPGTDETLTVELGEVCLSIIGSVVWCHAGTDPSRNIRYTTGILVRRAGERLETLLHVLCETGAARIDLDGPHRRLEMLRQRSLDKATRRAPRVTRRMVPNDDLLLIRQVRERLATNPDQAVQWFNRARFAMKDPEVLRFVNVETPWRNEILAVWEYLDRSISLSTVMAAFRAR